MSALINRLLIANRGEIAMRIIRAAHSLGIFTIAVYSDADCDAQHVRAAGAAVPIGAAPATQSYLNVERLIEAARSTQADAIHPGYGFLSENAAFARACSAAGLSFIGPSGDAIEAMADKALAKKRVSAAGVTCLEGDSPDDESLEAIVAAGERLGMPLMIKARAGGGGRGMRLVQTPGDFKAAVQSAQQEALASFGDARLLLERALLAPRHIEVQVLADQYGHVIHLGERECSIQRRHQKIIEETPSPFVDAALRKALLEAAITVTRAVDYCGAGTVEFLVQGGGSPAFYFMEMNTRLQVEHAVTEAVCGLDLVVMQLQLARGASLADLVPGLQGGVHFTGHAIEARLCAEDPDAGFLPASGTVLDWRGPALLRVDHALREGLVIGNWYDSLLAKLVAHGETRNEARMRLAGGLDATVLLGVTTNRTFLARLLRHSAFIDANTPTDFIERERSSGSLGSDRPPESLWALAAAMLASGVASKRADPPEHWNWRTGAELSRPVRLAWGQTEREGRVTLFSERRSRVELEGAAAPFSVQIEGARDADGVVRVRLDGVLVALLVHPVSDGLYVHTEGCDGLFVDRTRSARSIGSDESTGLAHYSPINGRVVAIEVGLGQAVRRGDVLVVLEAMKMEHPIVAACDGAIAEVLAQSGAQVMPGQLLVRLSGST